MSTVPVASEESKLEDAGYRASGALSTPITPGEMGLAAATGAAMPYGLSQAMYHGSKYFSRKNRAQAASDLVNTGMTPGAQERLRSSYVDSGHAPEQAEALVKRRIASPTNTAAQGYTKQRANKIVDRAWRMNNPSPTVGGALKTFLLPTLPMMALGTAFSGLRPLSDPKYQRGERGYLSSWWEGQKGDAEQLGQKSQEVKDRYGSVLGAPVQAFHGLMNPVASLIHGGTAVKDYFTGKQAALLVAHADEMIRRAVQKV